jgi:hypothetical protein
VKSADHTCGAIKKIQMKNVLFVLLLVFAGLIGYSQTEKGTMFIGGGINFSGNSDVNLDTVTRYDICSYGVNIHPDFGYFVKDNLAIGVMLNLGYSSSKNSYDRKYPNTSNQTDNRTSYMVGAGFFGNYYIKISEHFDFLINGEVSFAYNTSVLKRSTSDTSNQYNALYPEKTDNRGYTAGVSFSPGVVWFINPKLGIQASFGRLYYNYSYSKDHNVDFDNYDKSSNYGVSLNLSTLYFGFAYYFK